MRLKQITNITLYISNLLQFLQSIFKKILSIGANKKELVSEQLIEFYYNHLCKCGLLIHQIDRKIELLSSN